MKRTVFTALTLSLACSSLVAASGSEAFARIDSQPVTLTFWKEPTMPGNETTFYGKIIKAFEMQNPNIKVNFLSVPWSSAQQKMTAAFASNNPPDITYQLDMWIDQFASQNALLPLKSLPNANALLQGNYPLAIRSATYKGDVYAVPYLSDFWPLVMNETVWERAGKPKLPQTYSQLANFARELTFDAHGKHPGQAGFDKSHIATYGFMQQDDWTLSSNYLYVYLWAFGSDVYNKTGTDIGFNDPQGHAALDWLKNLMDQGVATPPRLYTNYNEWLNALAGGKISIEWFQGYIPTMFKVNPKVKLMVLPVPKGPGGQYVLGQTGLLAISAKSKHPAEALKFIQFLENNQNESAFLRAVPFFPVKGMSPDLFKGLGPNGTFMTAAAPQEKYAHSYDLGLKYSADQVVIGEINNYLEGRESWQTMISNASQQVQTMAGNAGQ